MHLVALLQLHGDAHADLVVARLDRKAAFGVDGAAVQLVALELEGRLAQVQVEAEDALVGTRNGEHAVVLAAHAAQVLELALVAAEGAAHVQPQPRARERVVHVAHRHAFQVLAAQLLGEVLDDEVEQRVQLAHLTESAVVGRFFTDILEKVLEMKKKTL